MFFFVCLGEGTLGFSIFIRRPSNAVTGAYGARTFNTTIFYSNYPSPTPPRRSSSSRAEPGGAPPPQAVVTLKARNLQCILHFFQKKKKRTKNIERERQFPDLGDFRGSKTRVLASSFTVFRTRAPKIIRKTPLFPHLAVKLLKKKFLRKIQGSSFSANPKTLCFTLFQALFPCKNAAKCSQTLFFHFGKAAKHVVWGSPKGLQKAQKA